MLAALLLAGQAAAAAPAPPDPPPAQTALTVPASYRLIEGIASDGQSIWLSSILDRKLIAYRDGRFRDFTLPEGIGAPLGIAWHAGRKWLWIAANCPDGLIIADCSGSALIAVDRRGRVKATLGAPNGKPFTPGDLSVWRDRMFVSDSLNGALYTCAGACKALTAIVAPRQKGSAQGSVVYDNGRKLLLADYGLGILSIDLATGKETPVLREDGRTLRGVDGMIADRDGSFLAVRNAAVPGAVVRFRVRDDKLTDLEVVATGGVVNDPTQIVRDGGRILVIGDSQWATHLPDKDGKRASDQKPTVIATFPAR